ncbi:MAG: 3-hydroxyacyl-CoA dehydrogenase NAD-binding domain-containing protein, partial [Proteobacteria bacterium]|nr:3-hydroxyacyl-CoA dehydrogenase NAD-binding domain-containing protein [Pseudomonadota bacterium]
DLIAGAIEFAKRKGKQGGKHPLVRDKNDKVLADRANPAIFKEAEAFLSRRLRGQFNGQMAYECVKAAVLVDGFDAGMKVERDNFQKCLTHPQRAAMIHVFFAERQGARIPDVPSEIPKKTIKSAATVGAGLMGGGIAMNFANVGIPVKVLEVNDDALQKGLGIIKKNYARMVQSGRITQAQMDERCALIQGTTDYSALADADVVIEAVYENLDLKKQILKKLDDTMKPGAILASNTSALDIDQMAAMTKRPQDVIGLHFFSPANVMQLLEVVRGEKSAKTTIATAMALGKTIEKIPVLSRNERGFIGNRMLGGYTQQAGEIILQGALPEQVDKVIYDGWRARQMSGMKPEDVPPTARVVDKLCALGRFGQKTNAGYYRYAEGSRQGVPDADVAKLIVETSKELGITRRSIGDDEVLKRCLYPLINIGADLLDKGVALRASDIDVVYVYGYGFPKYRGGPMYYADQIGLDSIYQDILKFHQEYGAAWKPSALLARLAKAGKTFASLTE